MIAVLIGWEAVGRLLHPVPIAFDEAIAVAALGLCVNLASAWLLRDEEHHHGARAHHADDDHDHHHGLVGAGVIVNWSWGLITAAGVVLLDLRSDAGLAAEIRRRLERSGDRVADLHLWRVGPGHNAAVVSLVAERAEAPAAYKARLADLPGLSHVSVEVETCPGPHESSP
jgi:Co/Zn/Cd efflux system component